MQLITNLVALFWITNTCSGAFGPKRLYTMDLPKSAVSVKVIGKDLIILGPYYIGSVTNVHWKFRQPSRMTPRIINKDIPNPRAVGKVPASTFSGSKALTYWVATWGSNDTSGAVYVLRPTTTYSVWKDITIDTGWNYERSMWVDMNKDGRVDCLTARFRGGVGQLVWFEQPKGQDKWNQHIINQGMADGNFLGFVKGGKTYVLIASLQFSALGLVWTMHRKNLWVNDEMIRHRVVDNYGKFYDVQYVDLNRDGRPDVLTTTVNIGNSRGHVLGYEVPNDVQNKIWKRRVLAAGFQGDYSPGKATAFWPNKWKGKTDRPSIFLSGAGQELLYILTPKPARTGWSYIKSALKAGVGMIGIPFIRDIDGDSYPEVFVPQGDKLHVFSYDYNAAVAEPANTPAPAGRVTRRPVVRYMPPYFRPGMSPLRNRSATAPRAAPGLPLESDTQTLPPLENLPRFVPRGGSTANNRPTSNNGGGSSPGRSQPAGSSNTGVSVRNPGQTPNEPSVVFQPIMTNDGRVAFMPVSNEASQDNGQEEPPPQSSQDAGVNVVQPGSNPLENDGTPPFQNNPPQNGAYSPRETSLNPVYEDEVDDNQYQYSYADDETDYGNAYEVQEAPPNLILSITPDSYRYQEEAADACTFEDKVLCSLMQLESATSAGELPPIEWGWFETPGRAAEIKSCIPGDVRWQGFKCHNGVIGHAPVQQSAYLKGYCCAVMRGANITDRRYSTFTQAKIGCNEIGHHICTLEEMYRVWDKSSYKSDMWGWFHDDRHLVKMVHSCNPNQQLWPGYQCLQGRLVTSEIMTSNVQESAYCCHTSSTSSNARLNSYFVLFSFLIAFAMR